MSDDLDKAWGLALGIPFLFIAIFCIILFGFMVRECVVSLKPIFYYTDVDLSKFYEDPDFEEDT